MMAERSFKVKFHSRPRASHLAWRRSRQNRHLFLHRPLASEFALPWFLR
jgi:hypothetical protein